MGNGQAKVKGAWVLHAQGQGGGGVEGEVHTSRTWSSSVCIHEGEFNESCGGRALQRNNLPQTIRIFLRITAKRQFNNCTEQNGVGLKGCRQHV